MSREWEPGEIVVGLLDGNEIVGIVRGGGKRMFYADSVTTDQVDLKHVRNLRRLAVIDPEDAEQVERLRFMISDLVSPSQLREALAHFADPRPTVYAHVTSIPVGGVVQALCGKTFRPHLNDEVIVEDNCPECRELAKGWTA